MVQPAISITSWRGETARHRDLKALAMDWARQEGLAFVAPEVSFPHRRFRVDVAACAPERKVPSRRPVAAISSVLKAAVVFECKQCRSDLVRDNKRRELLSERLRTLEARRMRLESLLHLHLPHLANGESLFPEFDSYRLREHRHAGYEKLLRELRIHKRGVINATKFDRLTRYRIANLHYLVAEDSLIARHELPCGWGLLVRREGGLELAEKPSWQAIGVEEQIVFLQRIAARASGRSSTWPREEKAQLRRTLRVNSAAAHFNTLAAEGGRRIPQLTPKAAQPSSVPGAIPATRPPCRAELATT